MSTNKPIAVFEGYVDGMPRIRFTDDSVPVGTELYACPVAAPSLVDHSVPEPVLPGPGMRNAYDRIYTPSVFESAPEIEPEVAASAPVSEQAAPSVPERLRKIARLLLTQDNRITDAPLFIVQQKHSYVTEEGYNDSRFEWREDDSDHLLASPLRAARLELLHQNFRDTPGWKRYAVFDNWEFVTACFTEQGCKDYLRINGHNLCEPRIYADSSFRNEEYRFVREWLMSLAAAPSAPAIAAKDADLPPPTSLPTWSECRRIIENHEFRLRAAAGLEGQVLDTPPATATPTPTALHRFIYEYDDGNRYRSAWFMHRLELVLKERDALAAQTHK